MTRTVEMRQTIETVENGPVEIDQNGDQVTLWWTDDDAGRVRRFLTLTEAEFDALAAERARFRRIQAMVDDAPAARALAGRIEQQRAKGA